jgi:hypothetical protein
MKFHRSLLVVVSILVLAVVSCSKSGSTGATGPAGPAGPAGPDSVVYSQWISLSFTFNTTDSAWEDTLSAPSITQTILDSGVILSYVNFQEQDGTYHVIPVASLGNFFFEDFSLQQINIVVPGLENNYTGLPYRYVTIPGSMVAATSAGTKAVKGYSVQELKAMPYTKLQQVLSSKN